MANKTTNKRTNNNYQTSNNKNSKRTSLLKSKFNLQSRKVQFFVVILIIAVIGGGYFTYKSFAATGRRWVYDIQNGGLAPSQTDPVRPPCSASHYVEPAKNNKLVWTLACPQPQGRDADYGLKLVTSDGRLNQNNNSYRYCAYIKGYATKLMVIGMGDIVNAEGTNFAYSTFERFNRQGSTDYKYICSPYFKLAKPLSVFQGVVYLMGTRDGGGWINVSSITLEEEVPNVVQPVTPPTAKNR